MKRTQKKSPSLIRQQVKDAVDSSKRTFKFKSKDGKPVIHKTTWTKTILNVCTENAEVYCTDVSAWARSVLEVGRCGGDCDMMVRGTIVPPDDEPSGYIYKVR